MEVMIPQRNPEIIFLRNLERKWWLHNEILKKIMKEILRENYYSSENCWKKSWKKVMIPQRNSGKSGNGGWGGLSRACITIESCTKWEKNEGKELIFTEKWKNVYTYKSQVRANCSKNRILGWEWQTRGVGVELVSGNNALQHSPRNPPTLRSSTMLWK